MFRELFYYVPPPLEPKTEGWLRGELGKSFYGISRDFPLFIDEPLIPPDKGEDFTDFSPTD